MKTEKNLTLLLILLLVREIPTNEALSARERSCVCTPRVALTKMGVAKDESASSSNDVEFDENEGVVVRGNLKKFTAPDTSTEPETAQEQLIDMLKGMTVENGLDKTNISRMRSRMVNERSYARPEPFEKASMGVPPSLEDLLPIPARPQDSFYISVPARILTFLGAYLIFPHLATFIDGFVDMKPQQLDEIVSKFVPGVAILYGTYISLTLAILYSRQREIQDSIARESSLLSLLMRNMFALFRNDRDLMVEAGKCVADQIRTLVRGSRGSELMGVIYSDPYGRMLDLIDAEEERIVQRQGKFKSKGVRARSVGVVVSNELNLTMYCSILRVTSNPIETYTQHLQPILGSCRSLLNQLTRIRGSRLSDEAIALPPTHFLILNSLTFLILLGYLISVLPTVDKIGYPTNETSLLFGLLTTIYVLFDFFTADLNDPYSGIYQLRRSSSAVNFLQAKWLIANHPWLKDEVNFEDLEELEEGVKLRTPGLGDMYFEKDKVFFGSTFDDKDLRGL